ncbi:MAG: DNA polymerase III subunit beta [Candidatus Zixiibacteriota bacterium]
MRLKVEKNDLTEALRLVAGVLPPRSIHPVLSNILLSASDGELRILGTDQDMTLEARVKGCTIEEEGSIGVPARKMNELMKALAAGEMELSTDNTRLLISQGKGNFHIAGVNAAEFPSVDIVKDIKDTVVMDLELLQRMISHTSFAVSRDIARVNFSGLYFKIAENLLTMVGTDGQRLILMRRTTESTNTPAELLIPHKTIEQIKKIFNAADEENVTIKIGYNTLQTDVGDFSLQSKLVNDSFPDYEQVIPRDNDRTAFADISVLESALARVSVLTNPASNLVRFKFSEDNVTISGKDYELGTQAEEDVPIEYKGEEFSIGFSSSNVNDVLSHIDTEEAELSMKTPQSAVKITPKPQLDNETYMAILMPLRLTGEE